MTVRLPDPCLVVLVGVSGSGKSTWARQHFDAGAIVSSDELRGRLGTGPTDQRASKDAFEVLELIVARRLKRKLATVIDSTALERERRDRYRDLAAAAKLPCVAITFDVDEKLARARNRARGDAAVPSTILTTQLAAFADVAPGLAGEGFAAVHGAAPAVLVPPSLLDAPAAAARQVASPLPLQIDIQVGRFTTADGAPLRERLAEVAIAAEQSGVRGLSVMDHMVQIPQVAPEWEDMLESYTALAYLAGVTRSLRLGALVTGITYRNLAHLAKIVATLDVVSGGRAECGLGAAWHEREHDLYGWAFPPVRDRYAALHDALELLPLMWGKGTPRYEGRTITVPAAVCYPRPVQEHIPILVGGSGERRTLRLVARHADACNLFGEPDEVRAKIDVLHRHCAAEGREPAEITVTNLVQVPAGATAEEITGRLRAYAEAGVQRAVLALAGPLDAAPVRALAPVTAVFAER